MKITYYVGLSIGYPDDAQLSERHTRAVAMLTAAYDAGTFIDAYGLWRGEHEPVLLFQTFTEDNSDAIRTRARRTAAEIRDALEQDCVGLSFEPVQFEII